MENGSHIEREMVHLFFKIVLKIMHRSCTLVCFCLLIDFLIFFGLFSFLKILFYHFIINLFLLLLVVHGFV
jgi:hypothetical protein